MFKFPRAGRLDPAAAAGAQCCGGRDDLYHDLCRDAARALRDASISSWAGCPQPHYMTRKLFFLDIVNVIRKKMVP